MRDKYIFGGIIWMTFLCSFLYAQDDAGNRRTLTFRLTQMPLSALLEEIEKQTGVFFSYESSVIEGLPAVTLTVENLTLEDCLEKIFGKHPVMYRMEGRTIILKKKPRQIVITGFVRDKTSSEPLIGASVYDALTRKGTASNSFGFFSLSLDPGDVRMQVSYIGYKTEVLSIPFMEKDTLITIELLNNAALNEVVVLADNRERQPVLTTQMGSLEINQRTIRNTPVMFGEADIIKTLQLTPGVSVGTEGLAGMFVRGGNVDENLFLIDGNPVYQVNHIGGFFSAFNSEAIRGMDFFKGGFPARYGGRLSSVVDVHTKEGNMKKFEGSASLGLISANVRLEGPIVKDRTSFMVSMRRTWLDAITLPAFAIINKTQKDDGFKSHGSYHFHDLNMKLNHRANDRSRFFLSLYAGEDALRAKFEEKPADENDPILADNNDSRLKWGNLMATAGWTYIFNHKLFGKLSGVFTQYRSTMGNKTRYKYAYKGGDLPDLVFETENETENVTGITDFGFRSAFDYFPNTAHHIRFGGDVMVHRFRPEYSKVAMSNNAITDTLSLGTVYTDQLIWGNELAAYLEDDWTLSHSLRVNGGFRYSLFHLEGKTYMALEPRFSLRWLLDDNFSMKASFARMNQYVHQISDSYLNLPTDSWMPVTKRLKPLLSDQISLGAYYNWKGIVDLSLEGYYKRMNNLLEYRDGVNSLVGFTNWEDKLTVGKGRSYGVELMIRKQAGRTTGWLGYALSWSDRKFNELNNGNRFPSKYDNRHKLNLVVMHKLSPKVELSASWTITSGNYTTLSLENYESVIPKGNYDEGQSGSDYIELDYLNNRNNYQLPVYHRLDLGINIYRPKKSGRMGIWNISVYNAYCRLNPFMIYKTYDAKQLDKDMSGNGYSQRYRYEYIPRFKLVSLLPIIPSITYTYKF